MDSLNSDQAQQLLDSFTAFKMSSGSEIHVAGNEVKDKDVAVKARKLVAGSTAAEECSQAVHSLLDTLNAAPMTVKRLNKADTMLKNGYVSFFRSAWSDVQKISSLPRKG